MKKTSILLVLLLATTLLLITSCSAKKLSSPENLIIEGGNTLRWNSVSGAFSYAVAIDGYEKAQTSNTYYKWSFPKY